MKKVYFLYSHPIQYFAPLIKQLTEASFCECTVLYCEDTTQGYFDAEFGKRINWDIPLLDGYHYLFLRNSFLSRIGGFFRLSNLSVRKYLGKKKADVLVVHGWGYFTAVFAICWACVAGTEVWLRGENPYNQDIKKSGYKRLFKKIFLQYFLFKMVNRFLYIGKQNKRFYEHYGVPADKLVFCPYAVDNERLQQSRPLLSKNAARNQLQLKPDEFVVLFSGKLVPKKNPLDVLKAFHLAAIPGSRLILLGDGELMPQLKTFITDNQVTNVLLEGFKNQTELPAYFIAADIFVIASGMGETWGLVVNEAMNYELPVISSDLTGSADDLVENKKNGYVFPLGDINQLAASLKQSAADAGWLRAAGATSLKIVNGYSYHTIITNFRQALVN